MFLLIAYYVIFYMCLLFTLWRMNKYQSINQLFQTRDTYKNTDHKDTHNNTSSYYINI